jgi:hypothetical protein
VGDQPETHICAPNGKAIIVRRGGCARTAASREVVDVSELPANSLTQNTKIMQRKREGRQGKAARAVLEHFCPLWELNSPEEIIIKATICKSISYMIVTAGTDIAFL